MRTPNRNYDPACADVRRRYLDTLLAEAERLGDRQLAHYAPVVAAVEGELAAEMGESGP